MNWPDFELRDTRRTLSCLREPFRYAVAAATLVVASHQGFAEQIAPNPNRGLLEIPDDGDLNATDFWNDTGGTIRANGSGILLNTNRFDNDGSIEFSNVTDFENDGPLARVWNDGIISFANGTTFTNRNGALVANFNTFSNTGLAANVINTGIDSGIGNGSGATFTNSQRGRVSNEQNAYITNSGELRNESATIHNKTGASLLNTGGGQLLNTNDSLLWNLSGGSLTNRNSGSVLTNQVGAHLLNDIGTTLTNEDGATLNNSGRESELENLGSLTNTGTGTKLFNVFGADLKILGEPASLTNGDGATLTNRGSGSTLTGDGDSTLTNSGSGTQWINEDQATLQIMGTGIFTGTGGRTILFNEEGATLTNQSGATLKLEAWTNLRNRSGATLLNTGAGSELITEQGGIIDNQRVGTTLRNEAGATITNNWSIRNVSGGTLTNTGTGTELLNTNLLDNVDGSELHNEAGANLINTGTLARLVNRSSALLRIGTGGFVANRNGATLTNEGSANLEISHSGSLHNEANSMMVNQEGAIVSNAGNLINRAALVNDSEILNEGFSARFWVTAGANGTGGGDYTQNGGDAETIIDGSFEQGRISIERGSLSGTGTVTSTIEPLYIGPDATVEPGTSLGELAVGGDIRFDGGVLEIEMGAGGVDSLSVSGTATFLGGTVRITFLDGFEPASGSIFPVVSAASITGLDNMDVVFTNPVPGLDGEFRPDGSLAVTKETQPDPVINVTALRRRPESFEVEVGRPVVGLRYRLFRYPDLSNSAMRIQVDTRVATSSTVPLTLVDDGSFSPLPSNRAFYRVMRD